MKALTEVVTFDRMSTREELKQVLDLLSDVDGTQHEEIWDLPETAGPCDTDAEEAWAEPADSEYSQAAELGTLASMLLGSHERTN